MAREGPSSSKFAPFYCEQAVITDVNRATWTCTVETIHSAKTFRDVAWGAPYLHHTGGEGIHYMPEVGAHCYIATPVDTTPSFVLAFVAPPAVKEAKGDAPVRHDKADGGSPTDVSYQANRPDLNPGDIAITTRDGSFLYLRRGGIVQLGATPMAQRLMVPVRNFIHDFAENYDLATASGDVSWIVDRPELDPAGKAPCAYTFHLLEYATDKKASVRVRHLPQAEGSGAKAAWEVSIAPQGIDRQTGAVSGATYSLLVQLDGTYTEVIAAARSVEVGEDDTLTVKGSQTTLVTGDIMITGENTTTEAKSTAVVTGKAVCVGDPNATEPAVLGNLMAQWLPTVQVLTAMGPAPLSPASIQAFQNVLSKVVTLK